MELWFNEKQTETFGISVKVKETLVTEKTEYQDLAIVDTYEFGRMLTLDGMVMTTIKDEFTYHEMMAHPILATHPNP
ncbi:spermidine synthase, partial [Brevibacillus choshinensis]